MEAKMEQAKPQQESQATESDAKHLASFAVMIVLTAIAFAAVTMDIVPPAMVIPLIIGLAAIQVMMQFFTFMHLDFKKHRITVTFIFTGLLFGVICVVALKYLV
ncbi:MAG: cytochrome C oxidase subunit IV family protein [Firmicutes bacterium]|nr:cytochrome C oxidase subunit IV family protein [Bacillota bacterium]